MTGGHGGHAATLRDYLHVVKRRKWIILTAVVLVPAAAIAFSLGQQKRFQGTSEVLLNRQNLANALTGAQDPTVYQQDTTIMQTQAFVARVPTVAASALKLAGVTSLTPQQFLDNSSVTVKSNADLLDFNVTNHDPIVARKLADAYASAYTIYRRQLDTASVKRALDNVNRRMAQLARSGQRRSAFYSNLFSRQQQLAEMAALSSSQANVVQQADQVTQVQPKPTRNGILGLVLGLVLGIGLAFLWEALDTRVRSAQEIGEKLGGLPLLARVATPSKKLRAENHLVMLDDPTGVQAETFRMLRTNLDFVTLDRDVRTIMVTSAVEQEGKSTTVANLAVALARAGQRVVLVDLDLRRPYGYVAYRVGDGPDAEDVTSETFERALRYRDSFDPRRGEPAAWLIGIARRCIADGAVRGETPTADLPELPDDGYEETVAWRFELRAAVSLLDDRERELVALRYGADLSAKQIGELLDMKTNAVEVALHRALRRLRFALEGEDAPSTDAQALRPKVSP